MRYKCNLEVNSQKCMTTAGTFAICRDDSTEQEKNRTSAFKLSVFCDIRLVWASFSCTNDRYTLKQFHGSAAHCPARSVVVPPAAELDDRTAARRVRTRLGCVPSSSMASRKQTCITLILADTFIGSIPQAYFSISLCLAGCLGDRRKSEEGIPVIYFGSSCWSWWPWYLRRGLQILDGPGTNCSFDESVDRRIPRSLFRWTLPVKPSAGPRSGMTCHEMAGSG